MFLSCRRTASSFSSSSSLEVVPGLAGWLAGWWSFGWILDSAPRSPHSRLAIAVAETGACETGRAGLGGRGLLETREIED